MTVADSHLSGLFAEGEIEKRHDVLFFYPEDTADALRAVELAVEHRFRLCPAGSITHLELAGIGSDCLVMSSAKMNRLIECSTGDLYATVQAGMPFADVNSLIGDDSFWFALGDSGYAGTVGGAVALGVSGQAALEPVHIKHWVVALSFVTPYGKHVKVGAVTLKSVAGYDIPKLLVGSRGQLGFVTSVTLRLAHRSSRAGLDPIILGQSDVVTPTWGRASSRLSPVEQNLKRNLDPHGIFPSHADTGRGAL